MPAHGSSRPFHEPHPAAVWRAQPKTAVHGCAPHAATVPDGKALAPHPATPPIARTPHPATVARGSARQLKPADSGPFSHSPYAQKSAIPHAAKATSSLSTENAGCAIQAMKKKTEETDGDSYINRGYATLEVGEGKKNIPRHRRVGHGDNAGNGGAYISLHTPLRRVTKPFGSWIVVNKGTELVDKELDPIKEQKTIEQQAKAYMEIATKIQECLTTHDKLIVHCKHGRSRTPIAVAAYLLTRGKARSTAEALSKVAKALKEDRPKLNGILGGDSRRGEYVGSKLVNVLNYIERTIQKTPVKKRESPQYRIPTRKSS